MPQTGYEIACKLMAARREVVTSKVDVEETWRELDVALENHAAVVEKMETWEGIAATLNVDVDEYFTSMGHEREQVRVPA